MGKYKPNWERSFMPWHGRRGARFWKVITTIISYTIVWPERLADMAKHYLKTSLAESKGNKTKIASLLGLSNYQTVNN